MRLALWLAKKTDPYPNPRVGAVIVKDGKILGCGYHKGAGKPHAEIEAMEDALRKTRNPHALRGAVLYVTLEPCSHTLKRTPPCAKAIIEGGIRKVVYAMEDPNPLVSGAVELKRAGLAVSGPTDGKAAAKLNRRYLANIERKPFVAIKMAMSADGKTATCRGDSKWISSAESREMVHRMRADSDAVMVGAGTVMRDDPGLTSHGRGKDPYRVIVDGMLRASPSARVFKKDGKAIVAASMDAPRQRISAMRKKATVLLSGKGMVDLRKLVGALGAMGIKRILIEGGSELNAEAIKAGIVDRIYLFVAPILIGGRNAKGVLGGDGVDKVSRAARLDLIEMKKVGPDLLLVYDVIG
ncbi:MAG: bifunctional diaminohydroxyphosphoribosylaminopyrimidine deaminase/5-amino-6-(5-phosphoribosylamino)uracil reductase RibD [Candidatus Micrarchaeota archaeon]